jgi:addiction module HigA family antidote
MKKNGMRLVPPGEILNEEFLKPLGLTANALAKAIGVPATRITAILRDERASPGTRQSAWERFSRRRRNSG